MPARTDFASLKFKPKSASSILQALSCQFFGCNLLVCVFLAFMICLSRCFVYFKTPPRDVNDVICAQNFFLSTSVLLLCSTPFGTTRVRLVIRVHFHDHHVFKIMLLVVQYTSVHVWFPLNQCRSSGSTRLFSLSEIHSCSDSICSNIIIF